MKDDDILKLFFERSEDALTETKNKYSKYCRSIAYGILKNNEDAEECVNDVFLRAWNAIPPARPSVLRTFLGKITRNLSLNALEKKNTEKRGFGEFSSALSELDECISDPDSEVERYIETETITKVINKFLAALDAQQQKIFVRRYWYLSSIKEIASDYGVSESNIKSTLFRLRKKLKRDLQKEGISL